MATFVLPCAVLRRVAIALAVSGCSRAPTMDLLGSYFPAWMLCAAIGVLATVIVWRILRVAGIDEYVVAPLLTYAGLALSATLLFWLLWFGR
jgi:YtcA family